jgi:hypothetical protein
MLCNAAEVRGSLLYILGGSPEWWSISEVPGDARLTAAVVVEDAPPDQQLDVFVDVHPTDVDPNIDRAGQAAVIPRRDPASFVEGAPRYTPLAMQLACRFDRVGGWRVSFFIDGQIVGSIPFGVRLA